MGSIKIKQSRIENSTAEIKGHQEAKNSQLNDNKECLRDLENRIMEITQSEYRERETKNIYHTRSLGYYKACSVQFSSVAQSCATLCDPMDCSMLGLSAHHQLPEFTQTHVHWVGDAIQLHNKCFRRRREKRALKMLFEEIMAGNFPNLKKEISRCRKHSVPIKMNPNSHINIINGKSLKIGL